MELESFQFILFLGQTIHLIDFATRLLSTSVDLSEYCIRRDDSHTDLDYLSVYLQQSCLGLRWLSSIQSSATQERQTLKLGDDCKELAYEVLDCVDELRRKRPFLQSSSFRFALAEIRNNKEILCLKRRFESLHRQSSSMLSDLARCVYATLRISFPLTITHSDLTRPIGMI
jgi:hypothetical protein